MFDFVMDIISEGNEHAIRSIITEMESLIDVANEKLEELEEDEDTENEDENYDEEDDEDEDDEDEDYNKEMTTIVHENGSYEFNIKYFTGEDEVVDTACEYEGSIDANNWLPFFGIFNSKMLVKTYYEIIDRDYKTEKYGAAEDAGLDPKDINENFKVISYFPNVTDIDCGLYTEDLMIIKTYNNKTLYCCMGSEHDITIYVKKKDLDDAISESNLNNDN